MEPCSKAEISMIEGGTQLARILCFEAPFDQADRRFHVDSEVGTTACNTPSSFEPHNSKRKESIGKIMLSIVQVSKIERLQVRFGRHGWCGAVVLRRARGRNTEPNEVASLESLRIATAHMCRKDFSRYSVALVRLVSSRNTSTVSKRQELQLILYSYTISSTDQCRGLAMARPP